MFIRFAIYATVIATVAIPAEASDILRLKHGYYVDVDTPCNEASNATLTLFLGGRFYQTCKISKIQKEGNIFLIWDSCTGKAEASGMDSFKTLAAYQVISYTEFKVTNLPLEVGENTTTAHFRYCPQSSLPDPWRSNDIPEIRK